MVECDYCDGTDLVYEIDIRGGSKHRCIPCLAIEQGQQNLTKPFEKFIDDDDWDGIVFDSQEEWDEHRKLSYVAAKDWYTVLARIIDNEAIVKRDPDAISTLHEHRREFLTNIMGEEAHHRPSELVGVESPIDHSLTSFGGKDDK